MLVWPCVHACMHAEGQPDPFRRLPRRQVVTCVLHQYGGGACRQRVHVVFICPYMGASIYSYTAI